MKTVIFLTGMMVGCFIGILIVAMPHSGRDDNG